MTLRRPFARDLALLVAVLVLGACAAGVRAPDGSRDLVALTFLQINDVYGLEPVNGGRAGGFARLATLVRDTRARNPNTFFVLAGDTISPSVASTILKGEQMIAGLNAVGLDAATFGNHEFDFGPEVLVQRMKESRFAWIATNVLDRRTGAPFGGARPHLVVTLGGIAVGVFGVTTPETAATSSPGPGVVFRDAVTTGREVASKLRQAGAQVVVAITHQSMAEDRALAAGADVDLILGGHEHEPLIMEEGKTLITKGGSDARYLVKVDLWIGRDGKLVERSWTFRQVSARVEADPAVAELVKGYTLRLGREMDVVVGRTDVPLEARRSKVRTEETNLGDLVADAMRARMGADVAVVNGGGIQTDRIVPEGPLVKRDIMSLLPFINVVMKLEMTGRDLRGALEHGIAQAERIGGGFLQVSGVRITWDPRRPVGRRIVEVKVGGTPLADDTTYTVAVSNYLHRGGDGFVAFARGKVLVGAESGPDLAATVLQWVTERSPIAPRVDGRIRRVER